MELTGRSSLLPFIILYIAGHHAQFAARLLQAPVGPEYRAVGASGATSAVVFASHPDVPHQHHVPVDPAYTRTGLGLRFALSRRMSGTWDKRGSDGIAHDAHFAGALVGILFTPLLDPGVAGPLRGGVSGTIRMSGRPAIFLDRDGVINRERGEHTWRMEDFEVLPDGGRGAQGDRCERSTDRVITNQSGIGLGACTGKPRLNACTTYLHAQLAAQGAAIDAVYYCPHHPTARALSLPQAGIAVAGAGHRPATVSMPQLRDDR